MSSSIAPPDAESAATGAHPVPAAQQHKLRVPRLRAATFYGIALTALLIWLSLYGKGGLQLQETTYVELALLGIGTLAGAVAVLSVGDRRWWGVGTLVLFAAFAVLAAVSAVWAFDPSEAWLEANRLIALAAVLATGIALVRSIGEWWPETLVAVAAAAFAVSLWALLTKILPETFSPDEIYSRLRQPYEYWNSVGITAAIGIVAMVWLGARREGRTWISALAFPAIGLMTAAMMLAYSRGSLIALAAGLGAWLVFVPLRLRSVTVALVGIGGGVLIAVWAFAQDTLTTDRVPAVDRATTGLQLGLLLAIVMALQLAAGLYLRFRSDAAPLRPVARKRAGIALLVALVLVPVALAGQMTFSDKGFSGSVSSGWRSLTDPSDTSRVANDPSRLTKVGSVRAKYWQEAYKIFKAQPWTGVGAGGYAVARTRYRTQNLTVRHAHGFAVQTAADLGAIGLALAGLLTLSWLVAVRRTLQVPWRLAFRPDPELHPRAVAERAGLAAMAAIVVTFGVHSFVDWTWYVPGNVAVALLCAGWVAGRGPFTEPASRAGLLVARVGAGIHSPWRVAGVLSLIVLAALAGWSMWRPLASERAATNAQLLDSKEPAKVAAALDEARRAEQLNPLSVQPLYAQAYVYVIAGQKREAREALVDAATLQPSNPDPWLQLSDFTLNQLNQPIVAMRLLGRALYLDPHSDEAATVYLKASRIAQQQADERAQRREARREARKKARKSKP